MILNKDCFFYKKSDFINRLPDISEESICYIADTQQIYAQGRYFECNVTRDIVESLIKSKGYLTAADLPTLTGGAASLPGEYVTGVTVDGYDVNVQKGKLSEIVVGTASKLEIPRNISLSGDASGSVSFDGSKDIVIDTTVLDDSHSHSNYVQKSGDTMTGSLYMGPNANVFKKMTNDTSNYEAGITWRDAGNTKSIAAIGYWNTAQALYLNPCLDEVSEVWDDAVGKYNLRIGKNSLTYNTYAIWHSGNDGSGSGLDADLLDGYHESSFLRNRSLGNIDFNTITESGIYRLGYVTSNGATNGPPNNEWGQMLVLHGSGDTIAQLSFGYSSGTSIKYRTGNPTNVGGSGSWNSWKTVLDSNNYPSYLTWSNISGKPSSFTPSSHTHSYSQISGRPTFSYSNGTLTISA